MDEVFLIVKADAVGDPGAVVVEAQDAALADGAVVAALRLVQVANQAIPLQFLLLVV